MQRASEALDLFEASLDIDADRRESWLEARCEGRPELLSEVQGLLEADRIDESLLERPVGSWVSDRLGERVGAFDLVEEIGVGGMGRVYRARRADGAFDQEVAVKVLDGAGRSDAAIRRFRLERQLLASFEHPGIARLIDGGRTPDGVPFVVMELVRGTSITEYCDARRLSVTQRLQLFARVCDAVEAAHRCGVVHRDLKPGNVLVTESGDPKVIDFGIAKVLEAGALEEALPRTATQRAALTPEYASPEQVRQEPVGPASDVYSLGILLYELLTGSRPYAIASLTPSQLERAVCQSIPADPSRRAARLRVEPPRGLESPKRLARILRGDLDRIVMTALRKEPGERYSTARALGRDIERYLTGHPVVARGASRFYRVRKFVERNPVPAISTILVFLILVVALVAVGDKAHEARLQAEKAHAVQAFLVEMIGRADPFFSDMESPTLADAVARAESTVGARFEGQPEVEADVRYALGYSLAGLGDTIRAGEQLEKAIALHREHGSDVDLAASLIGLAGVRWDENDDRRAAELYEESLEVLEGASGREAQRARYDASSAYSGLLGRLEEYTVGIEMAERAFRLAEELGDVSERSLASLWNNLATNHDGLERYDDSIRAYEKSIELHRRAGSPHPEMAIVLANLGMTYEHVGRMDAAIESLDASRAMQLELLGPDHPQTVLQTYNLGSLQLNAGDLEGALENLSDAVRRAESAYSENHLYAGRFHYRLAVALERTRDLPEARRHLETAASVYEVLGEDVPETWRGEIAEMRSRLAEGRSAT